jgi:hypothetical protein
MAAFHDRMEVAGAFGDLSTLVPLKTTLWLRLPHAHTSTANENGGSDCDDAGCLDNCHHSGHGVGSKFRIGHGVGAARPDGYGSLRQS